MELESNRRDFEQRQAEITHPAEQAVQGCLINHRAGEQRIAVFLQRDGQAIKPVCPLRTEMALDPNLIDHWPAWISCWMRLV